MRPAIEKVLTAMVEDMDRKISHIPHGSERMMLFGLRTTLSIVAREADRAAAMLVSEIDELSTLFHNAACILPQEVENCRLEAIETAMRARDDLHISALEQSLEKLRSSLIRLQAWAEESPHPMAALLLKQSWTFLIQANRRRVVYAKPW